MDHGGGSFEVKHGPFYYEVINKILTYGSFDALDNRATGGSVKLLRMVSLLQSSLTPSKSFTPSFHLSILDALASESMPTLSLFPLKTSITSYFVLSLDLYFPALPFHDLPFLPFIYPSLPSSVFIGLSFFIFFGISCDLPFACHVVCRPTMFFSNYIYSLRIYTHWTME